MRTSVMSDNLKRAMRALPYDKARGAWFGDRVTLKANGPNNSYLTIMYMARVGTFIAKVGASTEQAGTIAVDMHALKDYVALLDAKKRVDFSLGRTKEHTFKNTYNRNETVTTWEAKDALFVDDGFSRAAFYAKWTDVDCPVIEIPAGDFTPVEKLTGYVKTLSNKLRKPEVTRSKDGTYHLTDGIVDMWYVPSKRERQSIPAAPAMLALPAPQIDMIAAIAHMHRLATIAARLVTRDTATGEVVLLPAPSTPDALPFTVDTRGGWTWVAFPDRPSFEVRCALKDHGFRWSPKHVAWYRHDQYSVNGWLSTHYQAQDPVPTPAPVPPHLTPAAIEARQDAIDRKTITPLSAFNVLTDSPGEVTNLSDGTVEKRWRRTAKRVTAEALIGYAMAHQARCRSTEHESLYNWNDDHNPHLHYCLGVTWHRDGRPDRPAPKADMRLDRIDETVPAVAAARAERAADPAA